jgi:hypothetical protein
MRLLELPQPSFKQGYKGPLQIALRRATMQQRFPTGEIINRLSKPFLSSEVKTLKRRAESVLNPDDPAHKLIAQNMLILPHEIFLRASSFHVDNWLRDSFVTCLALNDPQIELRLLNNFLNNQEGNGHIPTTRLFASDRKWFFDDESTALALVWRGKIATMSIPLSEQEKVTWQNALNWLQTHN